MLEIDYRESDRRAILSWGREDAQSNWIDPLRRFLVDGSAETAIETSWQSSLPWWTFVSLRQDFGQFLRTFGITPGNGQVGS